MPRREDDRLSPRTIARLREYEIDPGVPGEGVLSVKVTPPAPASPRLYDHTQEDA